MAYATRSFENPFGFAVTPWVKRLLIAIATVWVIDFLLRLSGSGSLWGALAFVPGEVLRKPWTPLTYALVHGGFFHALFNMLGLFFFGPPLEERWGSREFLKFLLVAALGGILLSALGVFAGLLPLYVSIGGASAAVYGVMLAYAMYWPDNPIYLWGVFPVKAKWMVLGLVVLSIVFSLDGGGGTAHLAHLGGFASAFLLLKSPWAPSPWGPTIGSRPQKQKRRLTFGWGRRKPTKVATPQKPAGAVKPTRDEQQLLDDVDRILEKISARGLSSLTEEERKRLDEVSRRYRSN
ncbi:MAG TPA: rhomboid family intramembrane serine protease [Longimicrobiaceae bacterium]|nr:rhomboid family intramembrane serine protease [Longimicrobiaceae bacterium]